MMTETSETIDVYDMTTLNIAPIPTHNNIYFVEINNIA